MCVNINAAFVHNNRPAVLLMHPCITIGCQLISPLSKYLKALVLTKKSFHTLRADEKFGHILEKCSELFVPALPVKALEPAVFLDVGDAILLVSDPLHRVL